MLRILAALALVVCAMGQGAGAAPADPAAAPVDQAADPRAALLKLLPAGAKLEDLRPSPIPGIFEFTQGAEVSYMTADGKYFLDGNLYDMATRENLTEVLRARARLAMISAVPESQMVIFGPKNPLYTVTVFTDVDCPYCRKLHSQIAEYNRLGVRVRYLLYPRTGPNTPSWTKAEQVWCSPDRNEALTRAKLGEELKTKVCTDNPVAHSFALGKDFALEGTPAIVMASGELLPGYLPPDALVQHLKEAHP